MKKRIFKVKKFILLFSLIVILLSFCFYQVNGESNIYDPVTIELDCDKRIDVGTEITAQFSVNASAKVIHAWWSESTGGGANSMTEVEIKEKSGKTKYTPQNEGRCGFSITIEDDGGFQTTYSKSVKVGGIIIDIKCDVYDEWLPVYVNDEIILYYTISGGSQPYTVSTNWDGENFETEHIVSNESSGTMKIVAKETMKSIYFVIRVKDKNGLEEYASGKVCDQYPRKHDLVKHDKVEPSCTTAGTNEYWSCNECDKIFSDEEGKNVIDKPLDISATGHTIVAHDKVDATITESGTEAYWECTVCHKIFSNEECTEEIVKPIEIPSIANGRTGWVEHNGKWHYILDSGIPFNNGWILLSNTWYYLYNNGEMATGWVYYGSAWYYMKSDGSMATGWIEDNGDWYYLNDNGEMHIGWLRSGDIWYLLKPSGSLATGWFYDNGTWYYFNPSGTMATGWKYIDGKWYCFGDSGAMLTGWYEDKVSNGTSYWYWFDKDGAMSIGWKEINGQWEMFDDSGKWLYTWDGQ